MNWTKQKRTMKVKLYVFFLVFLFSYFVFEFGHLDKWADMDMDNVHIRVHICFVNVITMISRTKLLKLNDFVEYDLLDIVPDRFFI